MLAFTSLIYQSIKKDNRNHSLDFRLSLIFHLHNLARGRPRIERIPQAITEDVRGQYK